MKKFFTNYFFFNPPKFDFSKIDDFKNETIYIKRAQKDEYIPCLFIQDINRCNNFLLLFHDYNEHIFDFGKEARIIREQLKMNVVVVEYPGYSIYISQKSSHMILEDSLIVYDYIKGKFNLSDEEIFIYGRSIGSAPSIYLASHRKANALFVISGFSSLKNVGKGFYMGWAIEDIFKNIDFLSNVTIPCLFIHGKKDNFINYEQSLELYRRCNSKIKSLKIIENMSHNNYSLIEDIINDVKLFINHNLILNRTNDYYILNSKEFDDMFIMPKSIYKYLESNNFNLDNYQTKKNNTKQISIDINKTIDKSSKHFLDENVFKEKYRNMELIGEGAYGKIYKAQINENEYRAIKEINIEKVKEKYENILMTADIEENLNKFRNYISDEIKNMIICNQENNNPNSVSLYDYFYNDKKVILIMELCDINLVGVLKKKKKGFSIEEIYDIIQQLNNTFRIMVDSKIIHRDLKLENILVKYINDEKTKYIVKLADYGISRQLDILRTNKMTLIGTPYTMAPELLNCEKYDNKCDLWSLGVIIYQLFFRTPPFKGDTEIALLNNIRNNKNIRKTNNKDLDDLLSKLLVEDHKKRITWEQYFNHPFCK